MMATHAQDNLETVLLDYLGAIRTGDADAIRGVLDPNVTWQGLHDDWVCHGPGEVIATLLANRNLRRDVEALEFIRADGRVVMGVRGPALDEVGGEPLGGQIFNVFTLKNGKIVRIEDYRLRSEALRSAGLDADQGWR
jgi:ketosteroid isomerase-like protein